MSTQPNIRFMSVPAGTDGAQHDGGESSLRALAGADATEQLFTLVAITDDGPQELGQVHMVRIEPQTGPVDWFLEALWAMEPIAWPLMVVAVAVLVIGALTIRMLIEGWRVLWPRRAT